MKNIPIGEVLKEYGYITDEHIARALEFQKTAEGKGRRLGDLLVSLGFVSETQVLIALAEKLELEYSDLDSESIDISSVEKIPRSLASRYNAIAVGEKGGNLRVFMSDPLDFYAQEDIKQICGHNIRFCVTEKDKIKRAVERCYSEVEARQAARNANSSAQVIELSAESDDEDSDIPVIKLINSLLARGYSSNVSDIHIEPFEDKTTVRMRVDGMIVEYVSLSKGIHNSVIARIKIMADMDIAEKRIPQDGNFRTTVEGNDISVRVSVIPTVHGEKAVMRFLTTNTKIDGEESFGMDRENYLKMQSMLRAPNGIIYMTGPTGSGKTTTLYMILEELSKRQVNISTIEDPVEKKLPRVNQMSVNNTAGLTFQTGLRALLRQDPDIIMVGETRDEETASISVRAAITGHLVLSTLHTNDAASSVVRLEDMGIKPYLVANSVVGIVAQRLVRKVCSSCAEETLPTDEEKAAIPGLEKVRRGKGCPACNNTGFKGRIAIHEMIIIDKKLKKMISDGCDTEDIREYAVRHQQMKTLGESAAELVVKGVTTPDEAMRVAYYSD